MFDQIKLYANAILAVGLLAGLSCSYWYAYSHGKAAGEAIVQAKFDSYRSNINEQVQKARDEAAIEKQRQEHKYDQAKSDYADTSRNLGIALKRLRDIKTLPRVAGVQVAGSGGSSVSTEAKDTGGVAQTPTIGAGTCEGTEFWRAALRDTLQCKTLIEFVR